jgi:hypothetical protein
VLVNPVTNPDHGVATSWRGSVALGGNPGATDGLTFTGNPTADADNDGIPDLTDFAIGAGNLPVATYDAGASSYDFSFEHDIRAEVSYTVEVSNDLTNNAQPRSWHPATGVTLVDNEMLTSTLARKTLVVPVPVGYENRFFIRLRVTAP